MRDTSLGLNSNKLSYLRHIRKAPSLPGPTP
jgi:hypothetical protein